MNLAFLIAAVLLGADEQGPLFAIVDLDRAETGEVRSAAGD